MGFDDDIACLAAAPVLGLFDPGALRLLAFAGERIDLAAGQTLFRRGDPAECGYVVLSGTIALTRAPTRARTHAQGGAEADDPPAARVTAGRSALIGRNALFHPGLRPTDAQATEAAELMRISAQLMTRVLREFPDAAAAIYDGLAQDLQALARGLGEVRAALSGARLS